MIYLKFIFNYLKRLPISIGKSILRFFSLFGIASFYILLVLFSFISPLYEEGFINLDGVKAFFGDYCYITNVDYTAVLYDNENYHNENNQYLNTNIIYYKDPTTGKIYTSKFQKTKQNSSYSPANVIITEYLTFDIHALSKSNPFKEIWRELPETVTDGLKTTYDVLYVAEILEDGSELQYTQTDKLYWDDEDFAERNAYHYHHSKGSGRYPDNYESLIFYIPWTYRDTKTFKIVYSMNNAALKYNDCSELYLSMYSGNTITKLKSYKGQVLVPDKLMPKINNYSAWTFGTNKYCFPITESSTLNPGYHTFAFNLNKNQLKFDYTNRYIEFCLLAFGDDKWIFTQNAPPNNYTYDNVLQECIDNNQYYKDAGAKYNTIKTFMICGSAGLSLFIAITAYTYVKRKYNDHDFIAPEIEYDYFRDIPSDMDPIFAADLVFMRDALNENVDRDEEYAAILLSLVRKKYVKLEKRDTSSDWNKYNTMIRITAPIYPEYSATDDLRHFQNANKIQSQSTYDPISDSAESNNSTLLEPLTTSERLYFNLLKKHTYKMSVVDNIGTSVASFQTRVNADYINTDLFVKSMETKPINENGIAKGYFQVPKYDEHKKAALEYSKTCRILGILIIIFGNLISYFTPLGFAYGAYTLLGLAFIWKAMYLKIHAHEFILFTQYGADEQAKWRGLYNFLNNETLLNEKQIDDITLWEKYLIYATAFGISNKVIKAIKLHAIELDLNKSQILNRNFYIHSTRFHSTSRLFGHTAHSHSYGHHGSMGGRGFHASHGGYGGGGRGGGGGGGGH